MLTYNKQQKEYKNITNNKIYFLYLHKTKDALPTKGIVTDNTTKDFSGVKKQFIICCKS